MTEPNEQKRAKIIDDLRRLADALEAMQSEWTDGPLKINEGFGAATSQADKSNQRLTKGRNEE